jgi:hypothetical protein
VDHENAESNADQLTAQGGIESHIARATQTSIVNARLRVCGLHKPQQHHKQGIISLNSARTWIRLADELEKNRTFTVPWDTNCQEDQEWNNSI